MIRKLHFIIAVTVLLAVACKHDTIDSVSKLKLVFADSAYQFTGLAKEENGRLFVNYPRWSEKYKYAIVTANSAISAIPYPDLAMNNWQPGESGTNKWVCVQSVYIDDNGDLWVVDPAAPKLKTIQGNGAKLVKMNKATNKPERIYAFTSILPDTAYVNDVRIDVQKQYAYLTESNGGGIIVVNLATGDMRKLLSSHYSVKSDPNYTYIIDGHELMREGKPAKINSDGIALTPDGIWLYYKPLTDDKLYRIKTEYLRDVTLSEIALQSKVEDLGHFASTDGMIFDKNGNLYFGDPQHYRIIRISPDLKMTTLVQDPRLIWPDSYAIAEGYLYFTCSQIQKQPEFNNGINKRILPYAIYKIKI